MTYMIKVPAHKHDVARRYCTKPKLTKKDLEAQLVALQRQLQEKEAGGYIPM